MSRIDWVYYRMGSKMLGYAGLSWCMVAYIRMYENLYLVAVCDMSVGLTLYWF